MLDLDSLAQDPDQLASIDRTGLFDRAAKTAQRMAAAHDLLSAANIPTPNFTATNISPSPSFSMADGPIWLNLMPELAGIGRAVVALCAEESTEASETRPLARPFQRPLLWAGDQPTSSRPHLVGGHLDLREHFSPTMHPAQIFLGILLVLDELGIRPFSPADRSPAWSTADWQIEIPIEQNLAKRLAQQLFVGMPLFWADALLAGVAEMWQRRYQGYAEAAAFHVDDEALANSQIMARFPRFWTQAAILVHLRPAVMAPDRQTLATGVETICQRRRMGFRGVVAPPLSPVQRIWYFLELGEWVALYAAALNEVDPADQVPRHFLAGLD